MNNPDQRVGKNYPQKDSYICTLFTHKTHILLSNSILKGNLMERRDFIKRGIGATAGLLWGTQSSASVNSGAMAAIQSYLLSGREDGSHPGNPHPAPGELAIPPLLDPAPTNGVKHFTLSIQQSTKQFFEGIDTKTYGISADYLGPTLLMRRGEEVSINYTNHFSETTTMHGHGMHLPANMDGGPHQTIAPGATWRARFKVNQHACTNWYHPHYMGKTAEHVYQGLAGLIYIEDDETRNLNLPHRYAQDDIPLVVQDRRFDSNGQLDYSPSRQEIRRGYFGDTFLINGVISPYFNAEAGLLRMRLLNGSNARVYRFAFSDNRSFKIIAGDNSLLPAPVSVSEVTLSPGERAEIVVDLRNDYGSTVTLTDRASDKSLLTVRVNRRSSAAIVSLPTHLSQSLLFPNASDAVRTRRFTLDMAQMHMTINGKSMDMNRIDERVPLNQLEIWEVENTMNMNHNFHIHATHFTVLERDGSSANLAPHEKGYKDVIFMPPRSRVKLLVKMTDYKDSTYPYMYHCHILEHEDDGMMGQFLVT